MKLPPFLSIAHLLCTLIAVCACGAEPEVRQGLVGWWKLNGDCRDHSGRGNHGENHGVDLKTGSFDGRGAFIKVPNHESLALGTGDFSICAWVYTEENVSDVLGDIVSKYDPSRRKGLTLNLKSSSGGYQSSGDDRHVYFGIDNGKLSDWQDCGRPSKTSNYVSNSLTVYRGKLYAAITDAQDEKDWCHVYRYEGGKKWTDCGRVGKDKTTGVMSLIVHQGDLYAATTTYDWTRVFSGNYDPVRVYRYEGAARWADCGQPGECLRINCMASYQGKLYAGGDRGMLRPGERQWKGRPYKVYVFNGGNKWKVSAEFPAEKPKNCYPHAMAVHDGKLYVGYPNVYAFDGKKWEFVGTPIGRTPKQLLPLLQVHCLEVFRGRLHAGMWPEARAVEYNGGQDWEDRGRLGDGTEVNALTVYNGKLYGGAIPRAEVTRYDDDRRWTSLKRFYSPKGWTPAPPDSATSEQVNEWTRVTSLTVFQGRLFASIGSCTASVLDAPADVRGKIFSMEAGKCVSFDGDIGPGWKHIVATRKNDRLTIHINGKLAARSSAFRPDMYDITNDQPLKIGFGEMDYFSGKIKDVRIYNRALDDNEIATVQSAKSPNRNDGNPVPSDPVPILNLPGSGTDPGAIDYAKLPTLQGKHAVVNPVALGPHAAAPDKVDMHHLRLNLHNYLAHHDGRFWCIWSDGPKVEDWPTQEIKYSTSKDGLTWSAAKSVTGTPKEPYAFIARGLWLRDEKLLALGAHYRGKGAFGVQKEKQLELLAYSYDADENGWKLYGKLYDNAINNFAPQKLKSGDWILTRRDSRFNVTVLIGGRRAIDDWQAFPVVHIGQVKGFRPDEPIFWPLADGTLNALFRDNGGSRRLFHSVSRDSGRTWDTPALTNFPNATSKLFSIQTSRGYRILILNANPAIGRRELHLAISPDGKTFTRLARLDVPSPRTLPDAVSRIKKKFSAGIASLQYPHVIEHDGHLFIALSRGKVQIEVFRVSLNDVDSLLNN